MRKEQIFAIILGSFIGVAIAFGVWRFVRQRQQSNTPSAATQQDGENRPSVSNGELSIVSPLENAVVSDSEIAISGFSTPGSVIVVNAQDTGVAKTNGSGEFSAQIELNEGINKIAVWSLEKDKQAQELELVVIYTTKLSLEDPGKTAVAMIGTVTDISEESLQIRTKTGEIEQLGLTSETTYANVNGESKEQEFSDLAIGDFIAALGARNGESTLEVGRVLVTTESEDSNDKVVVGTIKTLSSREFIISSSEGDTSVDATGSVDTFSAVEEIKSARLSTAVAGDAIAIIGSLEDDELVASTIILL